LFASTIVPAVAPQARVRLLAGMVVWGIEQSEEFGRVFLRTWKGRMKGRNTEEALAELRQTPKAE
jgi:hypothetical protein